MAGNILPLNCKDFLSSPTVQAMDARTVGAYLLLLVNSWVSKPRGYLPDDEKVLRGLTRLSEDEWQENKTLLMSKFAKTDDGRIYNERLLRSLKGRRCVCQEQVPVPQELQDLELYRDDSNLCKRWQQLYEAWQKAFPNVDVIQETAAAHAWEIANPSRQKIDRPRFLANWFKRCQDKFVPRGKTQSRPDNLYDSDLYGARR